MANIAKKGKTAQAKTGSGEFHRMDSITDKEKGKTSQAKTGSGELHTQW